jgi:CspA family cold shock protein
MNGTVKWYNFKKGFGFIIGEDNVEYFMHFSAIPEGVKLKEEDKVTFDSVDGERGKQAQKIQLVQE